MWLVWAVRYLCLISVLLAVTNTEVCAIIPTATPPIHCVQSLNPTPIPGIDLPTNWTFGHVGGSATGLTYDPRYLSIDVDSMTFTILQLGEETPSPTPTWKKCVDGCPPDSTCHQSNGC